MEVSQVIEIPQSHQLDALFPYGKIPSMEPLVGNPMKKNLKTSSSWIHRDTFSQGDKF